MRLDKFLTEVQIGSRSQVKDYIKKGRISVNQVTVLKPEAQIKENARRSFAVCAIFPECV